MSDTKIISVKVDNLRKVYGKDCNLKKWVKDKNNVYIARKIRLRVDGEFYFPDQSIWANPYPLKKYTLEESLGLYRKYVIEKLKDKKLVKELLSLRGKVLGCWCKPADCHGDVLIELINRFHSIDIIIKKRKLNVGHVDMYSCVQDTADELSISFDRVIHVLKN